MLKLRFCLYSLISILTILCIMLFVNLCNHASPQVQLDTTSVSSLYASERRMIQQVGVSNSGVVNRACQLIIFDSYDKAGLSVSDVQAMPESARFQVYSPRLNGMTYEELVDEMRKIIAERRSKETTNQP